MKNEARAMIELVSPIHEKACNLAAKPSNLFSTCSEFSVRFVDFDKLRNLRIQIFQSRLHFVFGNFLNLFSLFFSIQIFF